MFKEQMNKIKGLIPRVSNNSEGSKKDKRKIENLVVFLIILIITLIAINTILKTDEKESENINNQYKELAQEITSSKEETSSDDLEMKIENILETMSGVR